MPKGIHPKPSLKNVGSKSSGIIKKHKHHKHHEPKPPDGGLMAWMIVLASFLVNGILFGVINSYSIIYTVFEKHLRDTGVANSESKAALVGSLSMGFTFFMSIVSGMLTRLLGLRKTAVLGGAIACLGLVISSFNEYNHVVLCFSYGFMYGSGSSLAYTPSLAILGHYFKKHLGMVNGIVTVGSSVFTVILPPLMDYIITNHGLAWLFRVLVLLNIVTLFCGFLFKPLMPEGKISKKNHTCCEVIFDLVNVDMWRIKRYRYWALPMPVCLFGYFVSFVHIKRFIEINFDKDVSKNLPLQCIAFMSGVGRLLFGALSDSPRLNKIYLQQISFYVIGSSTIFMPFIKLFWLLVVTALVIGLFDGCFISLMGPIAIQLVGAQYAAQAIGFMLGLAAPFLSVGPTLAGYVFHITKSYTIPFIVAGICPIVGASLMFCIHKQPPAVILPNLPPDAVKPK
ncbi:unnamed protein product [Chrysodeixis includens]|uniref:Monocarboxylate transporter 10 n=1 Tax=Chrysodeixis includens TaxID=689277 RepID=A0A9P0BRH7_CHRIL|nr:unnamed protein product [Chrysodeixis includens]